MGNPEDDVEPGGKGHWEHVYEEREPDSVSWYQPVPAQSLSLIERAGLAAGAAVIDVGGGASTLVDHLLARGLKPAVLDIAAGAIARARSRLGDRARAVEWFEADVREFAPPHRFALWHDRAVFHFLTDASDRARYLQTLDRALAADGQVVLATFALDGPERCSGLPVARYNAESLAAELAPELVLLESCAEHHVTPAGAAQSFVYGRFARR